MQRTGDLKLVQELNISIILKTIRHYGPTPRSEITKKNKINPTTVTSIVKNYLSKDQYMRMVQEYLMKSLWQKD